MHIHIHWNEETTDVDLADGALTVGGDEASDGIYLEGRPAGLLTLTVTGPRLTVTTIQTLTVGATLCPPHVERLVLPGEAIVLDDEVRIVRGGRAEVAEERKAQGTAAVAMDLLAGSFTVSRSRAAALTCLTGADAGLSFPLALDRVLLGRGDEADVKLSDRSASRRHAALSRQGRRWAIRDLGGLNGVYVNQQPVKGERRLSDGDVIELGQTMLRFEAPEKAPGEATVVVSESALDAAPRTVIQVRGPKRALGRTNEATLPLPNPRLQRRRWFLWSAVTVGGLGVAAMTVAARWVAS